MSILSELGTKIGTKIKDLATLIGTKQDTPVSGNNIKTISGNSILGTGDISIVGGSGVLVNYQITSTNVSFRHSGTVDSYENTNLVASYTPLLTNSKIVIRLSGQRWDDFSVVSYDRMNVTGGSTYLSSTNYFGYTTSSSIRRMGHIHRVYTFTNSTGLTFTATHQVAEQSAPSGAACYIYPNNATVEIYEYQI